MSHWDLNYEGDPENEDNPKNEDCQKKWRQPRK